MDILYKSLAQLQKKIPWANLVLKSVDIIKTNKVPVAGISLSKNKDRFNLFINLETIPDNDLIGVIEHELLHVLYSHLNLEWPKTNYQLANIAMDLIINETGNFTKNISLDKIDRDTIKQRYDIDFCSHQDTSFDIFKKLLKYQEDNPEDSQDDTGPDSFDGTDLKDLIQGDSCEVLDDKTLEDISNQLEDSTKYGDLHNELNRAVKEKQHNFKKLFASLVGFTLKQGFKRTFKKRGRRYNDQKGRVKLKRPSILLTIDTSGSMSDDALSKITYQVNTLSKKYDLTICWGDSRLQGTEVIKKSKKFTNELSGGGGTDLQFYKEIKGVFDLYIFNTDGYIPTADWPKKSIFCIYDNGKNVDGFKNLNF